MYCMYSLVSQIVAQAQVEDSYTTVWLGSILTLHSNYVMGYTPFIQSQNAPQCTMQ